MKGYFVLRGRFQILDIAATGLSLLGVTQLTGEVDTSNKICCCKS